MRSCQKLRKYVYFMPRLQYELYWNHPNYLLIVDQYLHMFIFFLCFSFPHANAVVSSNSFSFLSFLIDLCVLSPEWMLYPLEKYHNWIASQRKYSSNCTQHVIALKQCSQLKPEYIDSFTRFCVWHGCLITYPFPFIFHIHIFYIECKPNKTLCTLDSGILDSWQYSEFDEKLFHQQNKQNENSKLTSRYTILLQNTILCKKNLMTIYYQLNVHCACICVLIQYIGYWFAIYVCQGLLSN